MLKADGERESLKSQKASRAKIRLQQWKETFVTVMCRLGGAERLSESLRIFHTHRDFAFGAVRGVQRIGRFDFARMWL
jgi:hypothetical protein